MAEMIVEAVRQAWLNFLDGVAVFLPRLIATLSIVLVGWLIAMTLRVVTRFILNWMKFNRLAERTGTSDLLKTAELPSAEVVFSSAVFWIVWVSFLLAGIDALGFEMMQGLGASFMLFVPRLAVAVLILVAGLLAANFVWRAVLLASVNARLPPARLLAGGVRVLIVIVAVAMALDQIAVARNVVLIAFAIAFGAVMLGLAIAFGVGGGGLAKRVLEQQFPDRPGGDGDEVSHL